MPAQKRTYRVLEKAELRVAGLKQLILVWILGMLATCKI